MINNFFLRLPSGLRHQILTWLQQSPSYAEHEHYQLGHSETLLGRADNLLGPEKTHNGRRRQALQRVRRHWHLIITGIGLLLLLLSILAPPSSKITTASATSSTHKEAAQNLYLLIPTPNLNTELCRTIVTAKALRYPTPILIRWNGLDNDKREEAKRRLVAFHDYLSSLDESVANHTVILLLEPDTWFQLRPEVLLSRYYSSTKAAKARLIAQLGAHVVQKEHIRQRVTFSSSSICGGLAKTDPACTAVPRSTASPFVSLGSIIGSVVDVESVVLRAVAKFEDPASKHTSELSVLSEIFGEQELQREILRQSNWSSLRKLRHTLFLPFGLDRTTLDTQPNHPVVWTKDDEFGIHLDHSSSLSLPSTSTSDAAFKTHDSLPLDIALSTPPLFTLSSSLPFTSWSQVPLLTEPDTRTVPALLHAPLPSMWSQFWLHAHARSLLTSSVQYPAGAVASVMDNEGVEQHFWAPAPWHQDVGTQSSDGGWYAFGQMCEGDDVGERIFGDGGGVWVEPGI